MKTTQMTDERAKELGLWCVAWGAPGPGPSHMDCPVIVRSKDEVVPEHRGEIGPMPAICGCDCLTCKRAWWGMGRPTRNGDEIVTEDGRVIAKIEVNAEEQKSGPPTHAELVEAIQAEPVDTRAAYFEHIVIRAKETHGWDAKKRVCRCGWKSR